jgi:hypothetical protein
MGPEEVRQTVNRFQGLDQQGVSFQLGEFVLPARFEGGHSKEEKMAAVHYLRFVVPPEAHRALADPTRRARLVVDHPYHPGESDLPAETRAELLRDLG